MSKGLQFKFMTPAADKPQRIGEHRCQVCGGRASFGYGVSYRRGVEGKWYCGPHRPAEQERAA